MKKLLLLLIIGLAAVTDGAATEQSLNTLIGLPLFSGKNTWDYTQFARRIRLPLSGSGEKYSCFYSKNIVGAPAREIHVSTDADSGKITLITIYFANRGDDRNAKAEIKDAQKTISGKINAMLGKSRRSSPDFSPIRTKMDVWQCRYARFCLEVDKSEFVMLHIQPLASPGPARSIAKRDFSENLKKNDFGDVYIPNVPMVDQGSKGYCVPATFSRVLLYYGVNVDMHHLAQRADSDPKNGTSIGKINQGIKSIRRKYGLDTARFSDLSIKNIAQHIDKGHPIIWCMYSTRELAELYDFSKKNRPESPDPQSWERTLKRISIPRRTYGEHVCLIIGYNHETDEIAVSNSWGRRHIPPRWIPVKAARKVSQNLMLVIRP